MVIVYIESRTLEDYPNGIYHAVHGFSTFLTNLHGLIRYSLKDLKLVLAGSTFVTIGGHDITSSGMLLSI